MKIFVLVLASFALALPAVADEMASKVDLNKASADELISLPRVGPKVAARIIEYREQNGGFRTVEELINVRGIGELTFAKLRDLIVVAPVEAAGAGEKESDSPASEAEPTSAGSK